MRLRQITIGSRLERRFIQVLDLSGRAASGAGIQVPRGTQLAGRLRPPPDPAAAGDRGRHLSLRRGASQPGGGIHRRLREIPRSGSGRLDRGAPVRTPDHRPDHRASHRLGECQNDVKHGPFMPPSCPPKTGHKRLFGGLEKWPCERVGCSLSAFYVARLEKIKERKKCKAEKQFLIQI